MCLFEEPYWFWVLEKCIPLLYPGRPVSIEKYVASTPSKWMHPENPWENIFMVVFRWFSRCGVVINCIECLITIHSQSFPTTTLFCHKWILGATARHKISHPMSLLLSMVQTLVGYLNTYNSKKPGVYIINRQVFGYDKIIMDKVSKPMSQICSFNSTAKRKYPLRISLSLRKHHATQLWQLSTIAAGFYEVLSCKSQQLILVTI